jgi:hypothetical protein
MKGLALFSTTARYLDAQDLKDPAVRAILTPIYRGHPEEIQKGNWVAESPDGPLQALANHYAPIEMHRIIESLGWTAVRRHPIRFLIDRCAIAWDFFWIYPEIPLYYRIPEASFYVYQGLENYRRMAEGRPEAWRLLRHGPDVADTYFKTCRLVPTGRPSGHLPVVPRSEGDRVFHYWKVLAWWRPLSWIISFMGWLFPAALASSIFLFGDRRLRSVLMVGWGLIVLHAAATTIAAWQDSRFVYPVLPLYYIFLIAGIEKALNKYAGVAT